LTVTSLSTIAALWLAGIRSGLQHRTDTFIVVVMAIVFQTTGFAFIWVVLTRFGTLAGWTLEQLAFVYGLRLVIHALAGAVSGRVFQLEWVVRSGDFDGYLVRPIQPLVGFFTRRVEVSIFGDLLGGVAILLAADVTGSIDWTAPAVGFLALAILGGGLIEVAWRILIGALTFRLLASQSLLFLVDSVFSTYGNYPLTIFGRGLGLLLTFVVPVAFVGYLPAAVILGHTTELQVNPIVAVAAPIVGVAWLMLATRTFHHELRAYQSAGS
jgi:ABC-2 type transport system permease protein